MKTVYCQLPAHIGATFTVSFALPLTSPAARTFVATWSADGWPAQLTAVVSPKLALGRPEAGGGGGGGGRSGDAESDGAGDGEAVAGPRLGATYGSGAREQAARQQATATMVNARQAVGVVRRVIANPSRPVWLGTSNAAQRPRPIAEPGEGRDLS
ncbi:hypothetical protein Raf01_12750 [Rugosimonospora africana]|uniref:Uncharacterized protein n=1 Tax=Rugosimonospora africana TaxID=556532 RepID=A0A8J3QPK0_9ACTN|nr:hypothetical protein Raf01_12750 [Rugosimonospora africana]